MNLADNIAQLDRPAGLPRAIQLAAAEVLTAAEDAGHHVTSVSWFNPASTPEHHVPGFPDRGGVAVDFMVYGNKAVQDFIDSYMWEHRERLGLCWEISRKRIRSTSPGHPGTWTSYSEPDPHTTHTHANFGHLAGTNGYVKLAKIAYQPPHEEDPLSGLTAKEIATAIVEELNADKYGEAGSTEPDQKNAKWRFFTFLTMGYNRLVEIRDVQRETRDLHKQILAELRKP